jgi:nucleoside-diphosphate-sugar epimerase
MDQLVVVDKHPQNVRILRRMQPDIQVIEADLATRGTWEDSLAGADVAVILQAQIGDKHPEPFVRNNITATGNVLQAIREQHVPYAVHISSSVVESAADDDYTRTKRQQEQMVLDSGIPCVVLRPTLMFGWFDRKHLGWLSRFMHKVPVFPIPGHGRYMRQPLYVKDFCHIIISCIRQQPRGRVYNITGLERIDYIDLIRAVKHATGARTWILRIPYRLFHALLKIWALFDSDPPFTADQLSALVTPDEFEVIDWPGIFGVPGTPLDEALAETFNHPVYSDVALHF